MALPKSCELICMYHVYNQALRDNGAAPLPGKQLGYTHRLQVRYMVRYGALVPGKHLGYMHRLQVRYMVRRGALVVPECEADLASDIDVSMMMPKYIYCEARQMRVRSEAFRCHVRPHTRACQLSDADLTGCWMLCGGCVVSCAAESSVICSASLDRFNLASIGGRPRRSPSACLVPPRLCYGSGSYDLAC